MGTHGEAWGSGQELEETFMPGLPGLERTAYRSGVHMLGPCPGADCISPGSLAQPGPL